MDKHTAFGNRHPLTLLVYFLAVLLTTMFSVNPVMLGLALAGGVCFCAVLQPRRAFWSGLGMIVPLCLLVILTNPLVSHHGATPLFFAGDHSVTLEALLYGADIALMLAAVLYWCRCFNEIMTGDKLLYLFGGVLPKLSLVLTMALRFIPRLKVQMKRISQAQKAMGLYASDSYADRLCSGGRVLTALVAWSLENAVETAHSMKARGYGLRGRSRFSLFRFTAQDGGLLAVAAGLFAVTAAGMASGAVDMAFYPRLTAIPAAPMALVVYTAYGLLVFLPFMLEIKENLTWSYCISKI